MEEKENRRGLKGKIGKSRCFDREVKKRAGGVERNKSYLEAKQDTEEAIHRCATATRSHIFSVPLPRTCRTAS